MNGLLRKLFTRLQAEAGADGAAGAGAAGAAGAAAGAAPDPVVGGGAPGAAGADDGAGAAGTAGAGTAGSGEAGEKKEGDAAKVIPEEYTLTAPEGVIVDDEIAIEFKAVAKDLQLSQEEADKAAAIGFKIVQKQQQAAVAAVGEWQEAAKVDPEFGGENFEANRAIAEAGVDLIASPELKSLLIGTGMSENPEVFRAFYRLGKMIQDDKFVAGGSRSTTQETTRAQRMFGGSAKQS